MEQQYRQKRLGTKDMHTTYDIVFQRLEKLSTKELCELAKNNKTLSKDTLEKVNTVLHKRLDPQDRDTVEV